MIEKHEIEHNGEVREHVIIIDDSEKEKWEVHVWTAEGRITELAKEPFLEKFAAINYAYLSSKFNPGLDLRIVVF
ncbi:MAG: hypothetical protein HPY53_12470 [Brevinematales bacterium]|nr:hypothetical protein [Brevinematales bacterium]